ncbi:MerR family transcriptional regulator [Microbacterium sp. JZ31]|uniref:MerR family transcriptional regulator n=1 Tax=Microbacterium sp. JZ31 TaxID=1906274 RepID=UPI0019327490|nr:MerR family transcriptional regulator [Microbacterium sp. JZ31]
MRISELARAADIPVATVKYYLREGLLPPGRLTAATQAQYDDAHLRRLRLVRALLGPARLSIAQVRAVLATMDAPEPDVFATLGRAQHATASAAEPADPADALALIARAGWRAEPDGPEVAGVAQALAALDAAGFEIGAENLEAYLEGIHRIAAAEIANLPDGSAEEAVRYAVLGTVLVEPLLLALRRVAHQDAARRRFRTAE